MTQNAVLSHSKTKEKLVKVYQYVGASLLAATAGAYLGTQFAPAITGAVYWGAIILEFVFLISLLVARKAQAETGLAIFLLFGFTFLSGVVLGPTFAILLATPTGAQILINTLLTTGIVVGGLSVFAMTTKKDFTVFSQIMFIALLGLVALSIINLFMHNPIMQMVIAWAGVVIFGGYLVIDTQRLLKEDYRSPIHMAASLYLDILNIFLSLLQIFMGNSRD